MTLNILVDTQKEKIMDVLHDDGTNTSWKEVKRWMNHRKKTDGPHLARITVSSKYGVKIAPMEMED
jgi:anionic cell wall polymer biosynthesis LytR-Cps2A-Psr (LCP) family protein